MNVDELATEIEKLSSADRDELYRRLGVNDQSKMRGAEIRIDDLQGKDKVSPRATIEYVNGSEVTIDIIESVKANAISLGHPAILCAIQRWEKAIVYSNALALETPYLSSQTNYFKTATRHLERLSAAIISGAKQRRIPKEPAIDLFVVKLGLQDDYVILHKAWEWLAEKEIKSIRNQWQKLEKLETLLRSDWKAGPKFENVQIPVERLQYLPCIQIHLSLARAYYLTNFLHTLQMQLVATALREDEEHLRRYLDFLKSDPKSGSTTEFPLPSYLIATKLIPEASNLLNKGGYVASQKAWGGSDKFWFEFEDGSTAGIKVADAFEILGIKSERLRKEIAFAFGLKECLTNYPEVGFLKITRADVVCRFLRSELGKKFLQSQKNISWREFINAFDAWRLPVANRSLQKYRSKSKQWVKERVTEEKRKNKHYQLGDIRNSMKFWGVEISPHYGLLFNLMKAHVGQSLLPSWFNHYDYSSYVDSISLPIFRISSEA